MKLRELLSGRVVTISNILSVLRVVLVPVIGYLLHLEKTTGNEGYKYCSVILFALLLATDFLDGYLARVLNQVSRLGQFIDPLADKIAALGLGILLWYFKDFPLWLLFLMLLRDLYAVAGGLLLFSSRDIQVRPNIFGKCMVTSMGMAGFVYILSPEVRILGLTLQQISIFLILVFMLLSSLTYWKTYSRVYFGNKR